MSDDLRATVRAIKASGTTSLGAIAKTLQDRGIRTPAGATTWHRAQVSRLLDSEPSPPPAEPAQVDQPASDHVRFCQVLDFPAPVTPLDFLPVPQARQAPEPEPSDSIAVEITADHAFLPTGDDGNVGPGWEGVAVTERVKQGRRLMVPRAMADWLQARRHAVILPAGAIIPPYVRPGTPGR